MLSLRLPLSLPLPLRWPVPLDSRQSTSPDSAKPAYPDYPAKRPPAAAGYDSFDYARRERRFRCGWVKLHTVILVPKGATHAPILLTRTPYSADQLTTHAPVPLGPILNGYDNALK